MRRALSHAQAGIALAPLLMVIALIAVLISALGAGSNMFGSSAINQDRITMDLRGQIDQIRAKIEECTMLNRQTNSISGVPQFTYPGYNALDTAIPVVDLDCPGDPTGRENLWTGARPATYPAQIQNMDAWVYVNHGDPDTVSPGGICIRIKPIDTATAANAGIRAAIQSVVKRFVPNEYTYDPNSATQQLIIWIRRPVTGTIC